MLDFISQVGLKVFDVFTHLIALKSLKIKIRSLDDACRSRRATCLNVVLRFQPHQSGFLLEETKRKDHSLFTGRQKLDLCSH